MQDNPVLKAIRERRSIRKYQDKPVPKEVAEQLLASAVFSPSSMHREPWRFVVVSDKRKIRELSDDVKRLTPIVGLAQRFVEKMQSRDDLIFYSAPLLILVTAPRGDLLSQAVSPGNKWTQIDCGLLAQTMFLAAHSLGLGSCYIGLAQVLNKDKELLKGLGVPADHDIIAPLIFGYPAEEKEAPQRRFNDKILKWI